MKTRKKFKNKEKKVFTRGKSNTIIKRDYNPLSKDYKKIYKRGSGLFIEITKDILSKETMKEFIISKEDFKNYFNERSIISKNEYQGYLKIKNRK